MSTSPIHGAYSSSTAYGTTPASAMPGHRAGNTGRSYDQYSGKTKDKPGFFKRAFKASVALGGAIVGGLALKRYFPNAAAKVGEVIPGFIKGPFNQLAETGIAQKISGYGQSFLNHSEGWYTQAKQWISGFLAKPTA